MKLYGFTVTNTTAEMQKVQICRQGGEGILQYMALPHLPKTQGWDVGGYSPIIFAEKSDCVVLAAEGVVVELEWGT